MTNQLQNIAEPRDSFEKPAVQLRHEHQLIVIADVCFEMFSVRELKKPRTILPELLAAFPECDEEEILRATHMALSWKRLLRAAGKPLH